MIVTDLMIVTDFMTVTHFMIVTCFMNATDFTCVSASRMNLNGENKNVFKLNLYFRYP